ncbi:PREDICTED: zinc finger and BTB domain-containing protein 6 [Nanorana parkeri]|uniref:zinc finger and BTB domain-containing protein 6 n=1 Tax=Nanorana parkeri TaxID=125878 RepID=UPI000854D140|nr:PREDICTED: zinc finger and BTB domain-containing protein 6 [Nanorana parkeri]XP_018426954.1 PREDICTED: zinc finger and BTB domain-containing protein 6 [Nanorana parkeri]
MTDSEVLHFHFEQQGDGILHKMNMLREQNLFCDVSIYINDAEFHGHKVVFAACSTFMRDQFLLNQSRQVRITILQNADVGQKLLLSCYTGVLQVKRKELLKYLTAASYLQMVHIVEKCTDALSRYLHSETCDNMETLKSEQNLPSEPQIDAGSDQDRDCEIIELSEDSQLNLDYQVKKENDQEQMQSPGSKNDGLSTADLDYKESDICVFQMGSMSDNANNGDGEQFPQPCTSSKSNMYFSDTQHSIINSTVENRGADRPGGPYLSYQEGGESSLGAMQGLPSTAEWSSSWRHQCPKCPRGFLHLENYIRHLKMHKLFLCLQCGKTFTQKKNLNRHIRGHMGIRPFQCSVCLKTFTAKSTLQDHLNIHSGDRPYKCHCCDMDFKHKSALKKHLNSVHGKGGGDKSNLDITKVTIDYD